MADNKPTIYVLTQKLGENTTVVAACTDSKPLVKRLEKEVRQHAQDYYDDSSEYDVEIRNDILKDLEACLASDTDCISWTDGDEEYPLVWSVEKTELIISK